jgi:5-methyltetrahydrofolate--homocysteine methyltransferase
MSNVLEKISKAVIEGDEDMIAVLTKSALGEGLRAKEILDGGLMPGMDHVGAEFKAGRMFVPEVLLSARTMKGSMKVLEPLLAAGESIAVGKALMGTVEGDLHDIGKNLVAMMWKGANFDVVDLGTNVTPQKFVDAAKQHQPQLVGLSALLTTTMPAIKTTVDALRSAGVSAVKIVIGGAPVTQAYADEVGADGYAPDAASAVEVARKLLPKAA